MTLAYSRNKIRKAFKLVYEAEENLKKIKSKSI